MWAYLQLHAKHLSKVTAGCYMIVCKYAQFTQLMAWFFNVLNGG